MMQLLLQYGAWIAVGLLIAWTLMRRRGDLAPADARRLVGEGARLVDVRSAAGFASGDIEGAVNFPVESLDTRLTELGEEDRPTILYCASEARSAMAARMLKARGWTRVHDLGAMSRW